MSIAYQFLSLTHPRLRHAMSGRRAELPAEGDVGHGPNTVAAIIETNRTAFLEAGGFAPEALVVPRQSHGTTVATARAADRGRGRFPLFDGFLATDSIITNEVDLPLGIIVADCVPVLLFDPVATALGVAHAGWRGTVGGIVRNTIIAMQQQFGTQPEDLLVGIGPSIGPCCYAVGDEVLDAWNAAVPHAEHVITTRGEARHFDLWQANAVQIEAAGVPSAQIELSGICVRCALEQFFSYRGARQTSAAPGRNMLVAQLST